MSQVQSRYRRVLDRVARAERAAGRAAGSVRLIAVSKRHPAGQVRQLAALGQRHFGESYVQEALDKLAQLQDLPLTWHFIGPIQSNKTRAIATHFHWVHSVDRLKIAIRLSEQRPEAAGPLQVLLQVNLSGEPQKAGVAPDQVLPLAQAVNRLPRLHLQGLMTLPRKGDDPMPVFGALARLGEEIGAVLERPLRLSMGMSGDLEQAIAAGAHWVRVGEDIFGPRG